MKKALKKSLKKNFRLATSANPIFPYLAKQEMGKMIDVITESGKHFNDALSTNQNAAVKGGFMAEEFHAETFNLDAIVKGSENKAITDNYNEWSQTKFQGEFLRKNDTPDLVIVRDGEVVHSAQAKYYSTAEQTAAKMSQLDKHGQVKYQDMDQLIGPADQISPSGDVTSVQEHADAAAFGRQAHGKHVEAKAYENTSQKASGTLTDGKASSKPLTKQEADTLGSGNLEKVKKIEGEYQTASTLKHMSQAAIGAASMAAVVSGVVNSAQCFQLYRQGKITLDEAAYRVTKEVVCSAADSALKAGANAGVQSLIVRYGGQKAVQLFAKQGLKSVMRGNVVTVGVLCTMEALKDLVRLSSGEITKEEFKERQGKNLVNTSATVMGGSLGAAAASSAVATLGLTGKVALGLSAAGGLAGGLIAGMALNFAIEHGIEKPYRELVENTTHLHSAVQELDVLSKNIFSGQVLFTKFVEENMRLEKEIQQQFTHIDTASNEALSAILKI